MPHTVKEPFPDLEKVLARDARGEEAPQKAHGAVPRGSFTRGQLLRDGGARRCRVHGGSDGAQSQDDSDLVCSTIRPAV